MSTILQNSIWPNPDGNLGKNKTAIPDGVNVKWPEGDALIHNFVYKDGKLVGFVDTKALIVNDDKNTTIPYECVNINLDNILEDTMTITQGERCKYLTTAYADVIEFLTPKLKELFGETKFELYFEKDAKKLIIHTDRIADDMIASLENLLGEVLPQTIETEKYNHHIDISWRDINKYVDCTTRTDMEAINANYGEDVTSDLEWIYPLPSLKVAYSAWLKGIFSAAYEVGEQNRKLPAKKYILSLPSCTNGMNCFISNQQVEEIEIYAPIMTNIYYGIRSNSKLTKIKGYFPKLSEAIRGLGSWCNKLTVFDAELPSLSNGDLAFESCQLDKSSILKILNSIPSYTSGSHPLTIGIHVDYQTDDEVLSAIANAEAKGWMLTVQWNGTATTATASTFGFGELIYAKVREMEMPDGTTKSVLDWGHYVTDPTGYETFRSLESAYEHFGLEMTE